MRQPTYKKISHGMRINIIYLKQVHERTVADISKIVDLKYNSVRNVVKAFETSGRTNKKKYFRKQTEQRSEGQELTMHQAFNNKEVTVADSPRRVFDGKSTSDQSDKLVLEKDLKGEPKTDTSVKVKDTVNGLS